MEIMISTVIFAIGMLGMAGLQIKGVRNVHHNSLRHQATALVHDMAERIRANPNGSLTYAGINYTKDGTTNTCDILPVPATICSDYYNTTSSTGSYGSDCTATQIATYDAYRWQCGSTSGSSSAKGSISELLKTSSTTASVTCPTVAGVQCPPGSVLTVTIAWTDRDDLNYNPGSGTRTTTAADQTTLKNLQTASNNVTMLIVP